VVGDGSTDGDEVEALDDELVDDGSGATAQPAGSAAGDALAAGDSGTIGS
jgi:hypothetical protein